MKDKICVIYSHHKIGDLIWQLPYIKSISNHHQTKITLLVRETTQAKEIFADLNYISFFYYNKFRKKIFYWVDVLKLYFFFRKENFTHIYILDKINRPAIAAKLSNIKNIIGPGIKNQKKWLTNKNFLKDEDWKLNYSEQSQKFLKINNIKIESTIPQININLNRLENLNKNFEEFKGKKISFGVDSFEDYKMWPEEYFSELGLKLNEMGFANYIYLVCGPSKAHVAKKIINLSNKNIFINCSSLNLLAITKVILESEMFIGNNSGPLNLSAALNVKSYGLFANSPISQLKYSNIKTIVPDGYKDNLFIKNRDEMKKLTVKNVLDFVSDK